MTRRSMRQRQLHVCSGALASGRLTRPRWLQVRHGHVWVTLEGLAEDFWLADGARLVVQSVWADGVAAQTVALGPAYSATERRLMRNGVAANRVFFGVIALVRAESSPAKVCQPESGAGRAVLACRMPLLTRWTGQQSLS